MSHPKAQVIEISHDYGFVRYHLIYIEAEDFNRDRCYKPLKDELDAVLDLDFADIWKYVQDNNLFKEGYVIHYRKLDPIFSYGHDQPDILLNDTQQNLFNIPINLLVGAACTRQSDITFYESNRPIVRLVRHNTFVEVIDNARDIRYVICLKNDNVMFNDLSNRSIQFEHFARLLRCVEFKELINNGNLVLAYADSYMNNLDDDVIDDDIFTDSSIFKINYDQFTGPYDDNIIEIAVNSKHNEYTGEYQASQLDATIIELLQCGIAHWKELPSA